MSCRIEIHPAEAWADAVATALLERLEGQPRMRIVLPTGATPDPLYAELRRRSRPEAWSGATVVLLDDYLGLSPDDAAAGGPRLRRELVAHVAPAEYTEIETGGDPEAAARRLDAAAERIDLAVVGLGLNGHVGLNEPGSTADGETRVVRLHTPSREVAADYGASRQPERGITIGLRRLLESGELWLLVRGEHKAAILRAALEGPETPDVPASFLRRHPRCWVFADEPAAALLSP